MNAANLTYKRFENISLEAGSSVISAMDQDSKGMLWIGSYKGLYTYDGYNAYQHFEFGTSSNTRVNCLKAVDDNYIFLGTDEGLLVYDINKEIYQPSDSIINGLSSIKDVRAILIDKENMWIGSLTGLFRINMSDKKLFVYKTSGTEGLNSNAIYSIIDTPDGYIYFGTYNGLTRYNKNNGTFESVTIAGDNKESNFFVNSLLYDNAKKVIWIGTEGELYSFQPKDNKIDNIKDLSGNSIKTLATDAEGRLVIGTDNGLFIYDNGKVNHIRHDSRMSESLANDIIWSLFRDKDNNMWIGTDYGISLSVFNKYITYVPISSITGIGQGNHFYSIYKDNDANIWLGGTNGLISISGDVDSALRVRWFKPGENDYSLSHNRVRHIYQGKDKDIWVATDGSISRYSRSKGKFERFNIVDSTFTRNSNWAYNILEAKDGRLWIATCMGGLFVVDKGKLRECKTTYIADHNISIENGLFINQLVEDVSGNIWILVSNEGIFKADYKTLSLKKIDTPHNVGIPTQMISDDKGNIWTAYPGGVIFFKSGTGTPIYVKLGITDNRELFSMAEVGDEIWLSSSDGIWAIDKITKNAKRIGYTERTYSSLYYDKEKDFVYMGYADGMAITTPNDFKNSSVIRPIYMTGLYVNNNPVRTVEDKNLRNISELTFGYNENHLVFEFSDLPYSDDNKTKFVYMLEGSDNAWSMVPKNSNRITFGSLNPGEYKLQIRKIGLDGRPLSTGMDLPFLILPPWYLTTTAKVIWSLLVLILIIGIVNFIYVRNRLRAEHKEKERILIQTKQKTEFFANVSHEFKTPLSMIIAPVSRMLITGKDKEMRRQLEVVQRNALKLNSIIHKIIEFDRIDEDDNEALILSGFDIVELARNIFSGFEIAQFREKNIEGSFETALTSLFLDADMVKIESIITNLLSNCVKYCNEGASVKLSLENIGNECVITVNDNGIGIPEKDLPYVSQRFFQSSLTAGSKEGTGIGLYLVKNYAEMHHGSFSISSVEGRGTLVTISIPLPELDPEMIIEENVNTPKENLPIALLVDDNAEITDFIKSVFAENFRVIVARNGKEGITMADTEMPDVIITDLMMPEVDGLEMCKILRKNIRTSTTPIIMLTANGSKNAEMESLKLSVDAFITKPFDANTLLLKAEQLIKKANSEQLKQRIENITKPKEPEIVQSNEERFLSQITSAIENRIDDPDLNVTSLCDQLSINNKQMYRKLKQLTGMSPVEYIKSIRLKKAAMLLAQNKFTVSEVVYMVGFSNPSYFTKCFQAEFGKTPKQYMEEAVNV